MLVQSMLPYQNACEVHGLTDIYEVLTRQIRDGASEFAVGPFLYSFVFIIRARHTDYQSFKTYRVNKKCPSERLEALL